jgi:hypothetical protein
MKGFASILFPERKYSGYERSLERIDKRLKAANVSPCCMPRTWPLGSCVQSCVAHSCEGFWPDFTGQGCGHLWSCVQGNLQWYEGVKKRVQRWTLGICLVSLTVALLSIVKVCLPCPHRQSLRRNATSKHCQLNTAGSAELLLICDVLILLSYHHAVTRIERM